MSTNAFRTEHDSMGEMQVPSDAYWAAQTQRSYENFRIGTEKMPMEIIRAFEKANQLKIPYEITPRRAGDIAVCYADATRAKELLHWEAKRDLNAMCRDAWNWQKQNPRGYGKDE